MAREYDSTVNYMQENHPSIKGGINPYGARADYLTPFEMYGIHIPDWQSLPSVPIPDGVQISICVPIWNRGRLLELSLRSIFKQDFPRHAYEVIFVDDASNDNTRNVMENICRNYGEYNIRAFFRDHTTTNNDSPGLNIAFRRAKGWIVMINQIDLLHVGELLQAVWRHHNTRDHLFLVPKAYLVRSEYCCVTEDTHNLIDVKDIDTMCYPHDYQFFPHEWGASIRKEYLLNINGRDERYIGADSGHIDFMARLMRMRVTIGEDPAMTIVHRSGVHPPPRYTQKATVPPWNPDEYVCNKDREWGFLSDEELSRTIMTESASKLCQ